MNANPDRPLDVPSRTLTVIDNARGAAQRTRQAIELSFAAAWAGAALSAVGLGSFLLVGNASLPDWGKWSMTGLALVVSWSGIVLVYSQLWTWLRRGRSGGRQSPFGAACAPHSTRRRFGYLAIAYAVVLVEVIAFQALKGHIPDALFYGTMIWGTRLTALAAVAFFVRRFARSGFWEHLVFAAGTAATLGLYIFVPGRSLGTASPASAFIAALAMLATTVAAVSLVARWRRWAKANNAVVASDDIPAAEVG